MAFAQLKLQGQYLILIRDGPTLCVRLCEVRIAIDLIGQSRFWRMLQSTTLLTSTFNISPNLFLFTFYSGSRGKVYQIDDSLHYNRY